MAPRSFLGRVTKYSPRPRLNQSENRLTEITAGVLEHVDGFAQELVAAMLVFAVEDIALAAQVAVPAEQQSLLQRAADLQAILTRVQRTARFARVRTQVGTASGRFVDLEIRLCEDVLRAELDVIFWVEVKHGAPVHGDQLEVYELDVPGDGTVLVVAPLQSMPDAVPPRTPVIPWQRLADVVRARARRAAAGTQDAFVLNAFADYLKEENLMDDALTPMHALALEHHRSAERRLARMCQLADTLVEQRWASRDDQHSPRGKVKYEAGWWSVYPLGPRSDANEPSTTWRTSIMEWGLQDDGGRHEDARHQLAYVAGASMYEDNPVVVDANSGWVSDLRNGGFYVYKGNYQRVWKFLYPEQLLAATTLEEQARLLADWVVTTFEHLAAMPPPH
jgi:hypothetical protein